MTVSNKAVAKASAFRVIVFHRNAVSYRVLFRGLRFHASGRLRIDNLSRDSVLHGCPISNFDESCEFTLLYDVFLCVVNHFVIYFDCFFHYLACFIQNVPSNSFASIARFPVDSTTQLQKKPAIVTRHNAGFRCLIRSLFEFSFCLLKHKANRRCFRARRSCAHASRAKKRLDDAGVPFFSQRLSCSRNPVCYLAENDCVVPRIAPTPACQRPAARSSHARRTDEIISSTIAALSLASVTPLEDPVASAPACITR